jgi:hypothetical protein
MRTAVGIAIIITVSSVMAQAQTRSVQEQAICAKQAKIAFEEYDNGGDQKVSGMHCKPPSRNLGDRRRRSKSRAASW